MPYISAELETRTFLVLGKWTWTVAEKASGTLLATGSTHGGKGEAHLRAVHAASMLAIGDQDE